MLCVRCKHELPPRADRCLRCFALNPQNRGEEAPKGAPKTAPKPGARPALKPGPRPVPSTLKSAPQFASLSIDSDGPVPGPLTMSLESDPPAPVRLDFSSDPAPAFELPGEPQSLGLDLSPDVLPSALGDPFGTMPRPFGSRQGHPALAGAPALPAPAPAPPKPAFEEIPAEEISSDDIEAMLAAKKKNKKGKSKRALDFSEQPTEPPTLPPPPAEPPEAEATRLRAALDDAAFDHAWGQALTPAGGVGPFNSPAPPMLPASEEAPVAPAAFDKTTEEDALAGTTAAGDASPQEADAPAAEGDAPRWPQELAALLGEKSDVTTPGWVAAQTTDRAKVAVPGLPGLADGAPVITPNMPEQLRDALAKVAALPPMPDDDVPIAPPVSLPPARPPKKVLQLTPVGPVPEPELSLPPPPPPRTTSRARLTAWTFDAALLFTAVAGFVGLTAAVLGRPRLAPLGQQSPDSWADQLLFGRNLPLFWGLLLLTLGVAYSWLFAALGGRTPGMQLAGLRLRKLDGSLPGPALGLAHALLALPSLLGLFGFLSALFDSKCQTLHDKLLGMVVEPDE